MITAFHGIGAYFGQRNPVALRNQLRACLAGVEICVADRPIGTFGAVLFGESTALFEGDCWSGVDQNGQRYAAPDLQHLLISTGDTDQHYFEKTALEVAESMASKSWGKKHYCEGWMLPVALRALWVKDHASTATKKAARILAHNRDVPLITLNGKTRIWNLLDNNQLPFYWEKQA